MTRASRRRRFRRVVRLWKILPDIVRRISAQYNCPRLFHHHLISCHTKYRTCFPSCFLKIYIHTIWVWIFRFFCPPHPSFAGVASTHVLASAPLGLCPRCDRAPPVAAHFDLGALVCVDSCFDPHFESTSMTEPTLLPSAVVAAPTHVRAALIQEFWLCVGKLSLMLAVPSWSQ